MILTAGSCDGIGRSESESNHARLFSITDWLILGNQKTWKPRHLVCWPHNNSLKYDRHMSWHNWKISRDENKDFREISIKARFRKETIMQKTYRWRILRGGAATFPSSSSVIWSRLLFMHENDRTPRLAIWCRTQNGLIT